MNTENTKQMMQQWQSSGLTLPVDVHCGELHSEGEAAQVIYTSRQRTARGLVSIGIGIFVTLVSAFIPIAHFLLVPLFFVLTIIIASFTFRQERKILGGVATCPGCKQEFALMSGGVRWPLRDICSHCTRPLLVSPKQEKG